MICAVQRAIYASGDPNDASVDPNDAAGDQNDAAGDHNDASGDHDGKFPKGQMCQGTMMVSFPKGRYVRGP